MKKSVSIIVLALSVLFWVACAPPTEEPNVESARVVESDLVQESALGRVTPEPTSEESAMEEAKSVELVEAKQVRNEASVQASAAVAVPAAMQPLVNTMRADAADRSGVSAENLITTAAETVTWNDGSLGCPEPDMMYTMALVEGYRVIVSAEGKQYEYHTDGSDYFVYCANPDK